MSLEAINTKLSDLVAVMDAVALFVVLCGLVLLILRLLRGPHLADRAVALDASAILLIGVILLLGGGGTSAAVRIDGALLLSLIGFAGTLAIAAFIGRPNLGRRKSEGPP